MAGRGKRTSAPRGGHRYPRSARVGQTLREIIADELVRIDDDRLALVTITGIDVDDELNRAIVMFDSFDGESADDAVVEALASHRVRLQKAIGSQVRARKTPILEFRPDEVLRSAERIDQILRENPIPERPPAPETIDEG